MWFTFHITIAINFKLFGGGRNFRRMSMIKVRPAGYGVTADISERDVSCLYSPTNFSFLIVKGESRLHRLSSVDVITEF